MEKNKLILLQAIGREICEDCDYADCGYSSENCQRIKNALKYLNKYIESGEINVNS